MSCNKKLATRRNPFLFAIFIFLPLLVSVLLPYIFFKHAPATTLTHLIPEYKYWQIAFFLAIAWFVIAITIITTFPTRKAITRSWSLKTVTIVVYVITTLIIPYPWLYLKFAQSILQEFFALYGFMAVINLCLTTYLLCHKHRRIHAIIALVITLGVLLINAYMQKSMGELVYASLTIIYVLLSQKTPIKYIALILISL